MRLSPLLLADDLGTQGLRLYRTNRVACDHHVVQVEMDVFLGDRCRTTVIDVYPDVLNLERVHIAKTKVRFLEGQNTVEPAPQDAVVLALGALFDRAC